MIEVEYSNLMMINQWEEIGVFGIKNNFIINKKLAAQKVYVKTKKAGKIPALMTNLNFE